MKSSPSLRSSFFSILIIVSLLGIPVLVAPQAEATDDPIRDMIDQYGSAPVIIRLRTAGPIQAEPLLSAEQIQAQRTMISASQSNFTSKYGGSGEGGGDDGEDGPTGDPIDHGGPKLSARVVRLVTLPFVVASISDAGLLARIRSDEDVLSVQLDTKLAPSLSKSIPFISGFTTGVDGGFGRSQYTGASQKIAVLDTGVLASHEFLSPRVDTGDEATDGVCFTLVAPNAEWGCPGAAHVPPAGQPDAIGPSAAEPCDWSATACSHGTRVAGIAAGAVNTPNGKHFVGVASGAHILPIRVISKATSGDNPTPAYISSVVRALDWLRVNVQGLAAINFSFNSDEPPGGCSRSRGVPNANSLSCPLEAAFAHHQAAGTAIIIPTGNSEYQDDIEFPAWVAGTVTVGASGRDASGNGNDQDSFWDELGAGSNRQPGWVDLVAPGQKIESSGSTGTAAYGSESGTSFAAPHVAGAFAVLRQAGYDATVTGYQQALHALRDTGVDLPDHDPNPIRPDRHYQRLRLDRAVDLLTPLTALNEVSTPGDAGTPVHVFGAGFAFSNPNLSYPASRRVFFVDRGGNHTEYEATIDQILSTPTELVVIAPAPIPEPRDGTVFEVRVAMTITGLTDDVPPTAEAHTYERVVPGGFTYGAAPTVTTTTLTSSRNPEYAPNTLVLRATVSPTPGTGDLGMITFKDGATALGTRSLSGGRAELSMKLGVGTHSITAFYTGAPGFTSSTSAPLSQTVIIASTSTALSGSPGGNPPTHDQPFGTEITFTATVGLVPNETVVLPTGSVMFKDGNNTLATVGLVVGVATASFTTSNLAVGAHTITATFLQAPDFATSTSDAYPQTITSGGTAPSTTTTLVSASPNPSDVATQQVTLTASVVTIANPPVPVTEGIVDFFDNAGVNIAHSDLATTTSATYTFGVGAVGLNNLTAKYRGTTNFRPSDPSAPLQHTVVAPCATTPSTFCATSGNRFQISVRWSNPYDPGSTGDGTRVPITSLAGYFWFFGPSNVEVAVKVLDGTAVNGNWWIALGALSDVEYWTTVTDLRTNRQRVYHNPPHVIGSFIDTFSFSNVAAGGSGNGPETAAVETESLGPSALVLGSLDGRFGMNALTHSGLRLPLEHGTPATPGCTAGPTLCVNGDRFRAGASWIDQYHGTSGVGTAGGLTSDAGYFWFFDPQNVELVMKVLDGRSINGKFWVIYGTLSDLGSSLTVTDSQTGAQKTYPNPPGAANSVIDMNAF